MRKALNIAEKYMTLADEVIQKLPNEEQVKRKLDIYKTQFDYYD